MQYLQAGELVTVGGHPFTVLRATPNKAPKKVAELRDGKTTFPVELSLPYNKESDRSFWSRVSPATTGPAYRIRVRNPQRPKDNDGLDDLVYGPAWLDGAWFDVGFLLDCKRATTEEWSALYSLFEISAHGPVGEYGMRFRDQQAFYDGMELLSLCYGRAHIATTEQRLLTALSAAERFQRGALLGAFATMVMNWPGLGVSREIRTFAALSI